MIEHHPNAPCYQCGGNLVLEREDRESFRCCESCGVIVSQRRNINFNDPERAAMKHRASGLGSAR